MRALNTTILAYAVFVVVTLCVFIRFAICENNHSINSNRKNAVSVNNASLCNFNLFDQDFESTIGTIELLVCFATIILNSLLIELNIGHIFTARTSFNIEGMMLAGIGVCKIYLEDSVNIVACSINSIVLTAITRVSYIISITAR